MVFVVISEINSLDKFVSVAACDYKLTAEQLKNALLNGVKTRDCRGSSGFRYTNNATISVISTQKHDIFSTSGRLLGNSVNKKSYGTAKEAFESHYKDDLKKFYKRIKSNECSYGVAHYQKRIKEFL